MKRPGGALVAALCAALAAWTLPVCAAAPAQVGQPAPAFLLDTIDGGTLSHADIAGQTTFINVFATWCPPCQGEIPRLVRAAQRYSNVRFIFIDEQESPAAVKRFMKQYGIRSTVAIDSGQFAATYGALPIPESIVIDPNGIVRLLYRGPIPQSLLEKTLK